METRKPADECTQMKSVLLRDFFNTHSRFPKEGSPCGEDTPSAESVETKDNVSRVDRSPETLAVL